MRTITEKSIERLKNRLKDARANKKIVEGVNFSKMDLRDFDLSNLIFNRRGQQIKIDRKGNVI